MAIVTRAAVEECASGGITQTQLRGMLPSKGATNGEDRRGDGDRGTEAETDWRIRRRERDRFIRDVFFPPVASEKNDMKEF